MPRPMPLPGYGRELFSTFVPSSARARLDARGSRAALVSGALLARHRPGVVVEATWAGRAALTGVLRAARHADAVVAVSVPSATRSVSPSAPAHIVDEILSAVDAALYDRPLVIVARAQPLPPGASVDRLSEGLYRDVEAGYTAIAFSPTALQGDVEALVRVTAPLVEQDLGLEVELDGSADAALILARIDDAGLSLSAVRGAAPYDELGGALLVVDVDDTVAARPEDAALRVVIDRRLERVLQRNAGDDERIEAAAWLEAGAQLAAVGAAGASSRLLDALAQSLQR